MLTVNSSKFTSNTASDAGGGIDDEGSTRVLPSLPSAAARLQATARAKAVPSAMPLREAQLTTITSCVFSSDLATSGDGGGLLTESIGPLTITGSVFSNDLASENGGGLWQNGDPGSITITSSVFSNDSASSGGGLYTDGDASMTVNSSTFTSNVASNSDGGGIFNMDSLQVASSVLDQNTALNGTGGGLDNDGGTLIITASTITAQFSRICG